MAACSTVRKARVGARTSRGYVYQGIDLAKDGDEPQLDL
jgi:hypothetical protein